MESTMRVYEIGHFHLWVERRLLMHRGKPVSVGPKAVETLLVLAESAGEAISKEVLMERLWPGRFVEESNLAQNIYVLRKTFRSFGGADPIETVTGYGYRLATAARAMPDPLAIPATQRRPARLGWVAAALVAVALTSSLAIFGIRGVHHQAGPTALSDEAARLYAIGRYYWNLRTADGVQKSMQYFREVIDREPASPLGYVGMADAYESIGDYCYGTHRPRFYFARARAFAAKALLLDAQSAAAHATFGFVALHAGQDAVALAELRRAISLDPSYAPAHEWYGIALARANKIRGAWRELRLAAHLDPLSVATMTWLSRLANREHRLAEASVYRKEAAEMSPELTHRQSPPGHPSWASIENTEHLGPTVLGVPAYRGHETLMDLDARGDARGTGDGVVTGSAGGSY